MTNLSSIEYDRVLPPLKGVVSYVQNAPDTAPDDAAAVLQPQVAQGDRRDGRVYFYTDEIELHCNVAVATGRPLIVMGVSGCGKSSLAHSLARSIGCRYYEYVATSESQARDLFYQFDVGRRIADAQVGGADAETLWGNVHQYIEPGPMWWALDPGSASRRGRELDSSMPFRAAPDPCLWEPPYGTESAAGIPAVLLIDEIDKTRPDFTGNLLVPLGSYQFTVDELGRMVAIDRPVTPPLVVITSNQQRKLPDPMMRRCIVLNLAYHTPDQLVEIGLADAEMYPLKSSGGDLCEPKENSWFKRLAEKMCGLRDGELSTAEYLDAVHALRVLGINGSASEDGVFETVWRRSDD